MKRFWILLLLLPLLAGCHKNVTPEEEKKPEEKTEESSVYYVNWFGQTIMGTYYLWNQEISSALSKWETEMETDPIKKVQAIRYKADRWSMMTDDIESFTSEVSGVYKTTGFDFTLMWADESQTSIVGVVTFTYANSPARNAGMKRGDVFYKVNGEKITEENYVDLLTESIYGSDPFKLTLYDGRTVTLIPVEMEEDAVNEVSVLEVGDKKVGYLHFTSFTLLSLKGLMEAFAEFKAAGIDELVLDLRYNGGGYVKTCTVLASAIAPLDVVNAGKVFSKDIMNSLLTEAWGEDPTYFQADFGTIKVDDGVNVKCPAAEVNSNLSRVYILVSPDSASASESLICGLKPYMDVVVIGRQTHGKFCAGFIIDAGEWFDDVQDQLPYNVYKEAKPQVKNWGIYVMYARYADCNGVTLSMPDGIKPDIEQRDEPLDGFQLGDPGETLLARALAHMNGGETPVVNTRSASLGALRVAEKPHRSTYGLLVKEWPRN